MLNADISFVELMSLEPNLLVKILAYSGPRQRIDSEISDLGCIYQIGIKIHENNQLTKRPRKRITAEVDKH